MAVKNVTTLDPMNLFDITAMLRGAVALGRIIGRVDEFTIGAKKGGAA